MAKFEKTSVGGPGVPESFTQVEHDLEDHTGLPGIEAQIPPIPESFDQIAHDLEDHSNIPGVPDEFNWDMDAATPYELAHGQTDHTGLPGVIAPIIETYTQTEHDLEDHTGLSGVPSITGLLDETAHDILDHAGLTGIPTSFVTAIAAESTLPAIEIQQFCTEYNHGLAIGSSTSEYTAGSSPDYMRITKMVLGSPYSTITIKGRVLTQSPNGNNTVPVYKIFDNTGSGGLPGAEIFTENGATLVSQNTWYNVSKDIVFETPLAAGTYWVTITAAIPGLGVIGGGAAAGGAWAYQVAGVWSLGGNDVGISISAEGMPDLVYTDGDIVFTQDTNKFFRWDLGTLAWIELNPTVAAVADVDESATPTAVETKLNELLDAMRTAGILAE